MLLLFVGGTVWNRSLHRQVQARTKAVERTERRYRDLVDNASDMIYRTDPFGRFTFVNPVATRILGFDEGELLSMKYFELMRPDWVPRAMGFYEKSAKTRESTYLEFPVRKKDGQEIWVGQHVRPIITGGRVEGFQGMARDITDRVNAQAELRAERDFVSAILDTAPSLIMVLDSQGQIVRFNRACEELSGVSMSEVAGRPFWEVPFILDEERAEIRDGIPRLAASTEPVKLDRTWVGKNGARHMIAWTVMALRGQIGRDVVPDRHGLRRDDGARARALEVAVHLDGQPRAAHAADLDPRVDAVADRRGHDRQRRRRSARAGRAVQRRSPDSHRQRHPRHVEDRSRRDDGVAEAHAAAPIVEDSVRSVAGVRAGCRRDDHASPTDGIARRDRRSGSHDPGAGQPAVERGQARADRIEGRNDARRARAAWSPSPSAITVPGIPAHKVDFIFEPFTQLDGSDTRRIAGTGLGLTIARALAEKQGGGIRVSSREGQGATFTLTMPLGVDVPQA